LAANANPAYNRERFAEAHDLIIKTWTQPGPFRWEGDHYQLRVVNPWVLPLQQPHPRVWIPGVVSRETIIWSAEHGYPYIILNAPIEETKKIWQLYDETAARAGYASGPEHRGYLIRCHVAETEEKAIENAKQFMWMQGEFTGLTHPLWASPAGYLGEWARKPLAEFRVGRRKQNMPPFEKQLKAMSLIAGTPKQVVEKLRIIVEETQPSILALWGNDGNVSHEDSMTCIRLLGQEVMPAVREIGDKLGLKSPFEANAPVSLAYAQKKETAAAAAL
jgi:alkanesulfonate monooxygenase SsuD/methylene tetrahydromethanopterin reductase-like flavin-dependent oxidoreductase (luciferase family)